MQTNKLTESAALGRALGRASRGAGLSTVTVYANKLNFVASAYNAYTFDAKLEGASNAGVFSCGACGSTKTPNVILGYSGATPNWYFYATFPVVVRTTAHAYEQIAFACGLYAPS